MPCSGAFMALPGQAAHHDMAVCDVDVDILPTAGVRIMSMAASVGLMRFEMCVYVAGEGVVAQW